MYLFQQGSIFIFFDGRIKQVRGRLDEVSSGSTYSFQPYVYDKIITSSVNDVFQSVTQMTRKRKNEIRKFWFLVSCQHCSRLSQLSVTNTLHAARTKMSLWYLDSHWCKSDGKFLKAKWIYLRRTFFSRWQSVCHCHAVIVLQLLLSNVLNGWPYLLQALRWWGRHERKRHPKSWGPNPNPSSPQVPSFLFSCLHFLNSADPTISEPGTG